jgi:hypothetical protein
MNDVARVRESFGPGAFLVRLVASCVMVFVTWNPTGYSYGDWALAAWHAGTAGAIHAFVGVILLIGWVILLRATMNSLGVLGLVLGGLLLGVSVWLLFDLGVLQDPSRSLVTWIALGCLALLLGVGLSWSYLWKRLTGQVDVDQFDRD